MGRGTTLFQNHDGDSDDEKGDDEKDEGEDGEVNATLFTTA